MNLVSIKKNMNIITVVLSIILALPCLVRAETEFTPFPGAIAAQEVTRAQLGQEVILSGAIEKILPSTGERVPYRLYLTTNEASPVIVVYWVDVADQIHGDLGAPPVGCQVSARGQLSEYKGSLQIRVKSKSQLRLEGYPLTLSGGGGSTAPRAIDTAVSSLPVPDEQGYFSAKNAEAIKALMGQKVSVKGTVREFKASWNDRAPNVINLDGPAGLGIVYWLAEGDVVADFSVAGTEVYASGLLQEYKGNLQLKISDLDDLSTTPLPAERILKPKAPGSGPKSTKDGWPDKQTAKNVVKPMASVSVARGAFIKIRDVSPEHVNSEVMIRGEVKSVLEDGSVILADENASIRINLPTEGSGTLAVGDKAMVLGKVVYHQQRSSVEMQVTNMDDVNLLK